MPAAASPSSIRGKRHDRETAGSHLETGHEFLAGRREDVLRKGDGVWKVRRRTIVLDANVVLDENLAAFLQGQTQSARLRS